MAKRKENMPPLSSLSLKNLLSSSLKEKPLIHSKWETCLAGVTFSGAGVALWEAGCWVGSGMGRQAGILGQAGQTMKCSVYIYAHLSESQQEGRQAERERLSIYAWRPSPSAMALSSL